MMFTIHVLALAYHIEGVYRYHTDVISFTYNFVSGSTIQFSFGTVLFMDVDSLACVECYFVVESCKIILLR